MRGKSTPRLQNMPPPLPLFAALRLTGLLALCYRAVARCGKKQPRFFLEKSQSKKERGETAAAPNLKKDPAKENQRHAPTKNIFSWFLLRFSTRML